MSSPSNLVCPFDKTIFLIYTLDYLVVVVNRSQPGPALRGRGSAITLPIPAAPQSGDELHAEQMIIQCRNRCEPDCNWTIKANDISSK